MDEETKEKPSTSSKTPSKDVESATGLSSTMIENYMD